MKVDRYHTVNLSIRLAITLGAALGGLSLIQSSFGDENNGQFGAAPESLDYPAGTLEANNNQYGAASESFFFQTETEEDPFPTNLKIEPIDPIDGKKYQQTLVGPAFKVRARGAKFDYFRYVTMYNVTTRKERIYDLPVQRQECHDQSDYFATYSYSYSVSSEVSCGIDIEFVGLNASISTTKTYTMNRNLRATEWVIADHTPFFVKHNWDGFTFIQTFDSKTGKVDYLRTPQKATSLLHDIFFPLTARSAYPMEFSVKNVDWSFLVERTVLSRCKKGTPSPVKKKPAQSTGLPTPDAGTDPNATRNNNNNND